MPAVFKLNWQQKQLASMLVFNSLSFQLYLEMISHSISPEAKITIFRFQHSVWFSVGVLEGSKRVFILRTESTLISFVEGLRRVQIVTVRDEDERRYQMLNIKGNWVIAKLLRMSITKNHLPNWRSFNPTYITHFLGILLSFWLCQDYQLNVFEPLPFAAKASYSKVFN